MDNGSASCLMDVVRSRRSVRRYRDEPVPRELVEQLLDAAHWAPSAHNRQPWRFAIVEQPQTKRRLATAMGERLRSDLERDGVPALVIEADVSRSFARITGAPVVIVPCISMSAMDRYPDSRRQAAEREMAVQSVALAVGNLLLAAHARGLGACWMCAPLFVPDTVREALGLDPDWEPQALVTLGYPAETKNKSRVPLGTVVRYVDGSVE